MSSAGDDDFGEVDDDDLLLIATQAENGRKVLLSPQVESPEFRAPKRRRLIDPTASCGKGPDGSDSEQSVITPSESESVSPSRNNSETLHKKPNSKYKIHIPKRADVPTDSFYTQVPRSSQSPYRIRGPYWQKRLPKASSRPGTAQDFRPEEQTSMVGHRTPEPIEPAPGRDKSLSPTPWQPTQWKERAQTRQNQFSPAAKVEKRTSDHFRNGSNENIIETLADWPSDSFSSSIPYQSASNQPFVVSSQHSGAKEWQSQNIRPQRLVGPQTNLRQTTLFGGEVQGGGSQSQSTRRHNWPLANREEPPTHHELQESTLGTWIYPTNLGTIRDYQYSIVSRGLYHNLLVALPTGLGKTFIAATVMLNWFRWTKHAQIVFVAPTKPLVSQQVEACFNVVGISRLVTTMLTGSTPPGIRAEEWRSKRVFFMTPQTIVNDLKTGICDPKRIVLLVVDEAHRATGGYAYVEVVKFLRRFNTSFRVLGLTATPGASVEGVQEVIDGLGISRVEIRTEESIDIRQYVHSRKIDTVLFDYSDEMVLVMDLFSKALQPILDKLNGMNAYWARDPMTLTPYGCTQARQKWMASEAGKRASFPVKGMVNTIFTLLASLSHSIELLKFHGIGPFFHKVTEFRNETSSGEKGSKYRKQINDSEHFQKLMTRVQGWVSHPEFVGHPKLEYLQSVVLNHFLDAGDGRGAANGVSPASTRIMVFVHYRDSAEEVSRVLKRNEPMIRPHVFVGQANSKGSDGMDQKKQLDIIQKFKNGTYNTLVATSIGEEGLDIGEVDLIVCYDASASPIRMLQRMGRTGRKRAGNIVVTLMKGKEENSFVQAKDNYEKMQKMIADGNRFNFHDELSPRIMPREIIPMVDKKAVEIPLENTQSDLPEPKKRAKIPKRPPKKFHMPDGVREGFTAASRLNDSEESEGSNSDVPRLGRMRTPSPEPIPSLDSVLLTASEEKELEKTYLDIGGDTPQTVQVPRLDAFPSLQRILRCSKRIGHGKATKSVVSLLGRMHDMTEAVIENYSKALHEEDRSIGLAQAKNHAAFFHDRLQLRKNDTFVDGSRRSSSAKSPTGPRSNRAVNAPVNLVSTDEEEMNNDTDVLIEDDMSVHTTQASSASSPPVLAEAAKPFYQPTKVSYVGAFDSEEDLPEFDTLVAKRVSTVTTTIGELQKEEQQSMPRPRKGRRIVVESNSDTE